MKAFLSYTGEDKNLYRAMEGGHLGAIDEANRILTETEYFPGQSNTYQFTVTASSAKPSARIIHAFPLDALAEALTDFLAE